MDLTKPSLPALSYILRHPELWPESFVWDYRHHSTCAVGLTRKLWKADACSDSSCSMIDDFARIFDMNPDTAAKIFAQARRDIKMKEVTPEMVADDIDTYLAEKARL